MKTWQEISLIGHQGAIASRVTGIHEVDATATFEAKIDSLSRELDLLIAEKASLNARAVMLCETCRRGHNASQCPIVGSLVAPMEQADFVSGGQRPQGNPYSNTYNQGWRNHPNFSWRGQGQQGQQRLPQSPGFQYQPSPSKERKFSTKEVLVRFMVSIDAKFDAVYATLRNVQASIQNLENQVKQLTSALSNSC